MQAIELCDLKLQHQKLMPRILDKITEVIQSSQFINGKYVEEFEGRFTALHEGKLGIGCSNGTAALRLALEALGVGPGDEVIVPTHTFFATAEAVSNVGATPVFVDSEADGYGMSFEGFRKAITKKTRAVIPVHIYGNPVPIDSFLEVARKNGLYVIEDCAQSHFAQYAGKYVGTQSDIATFSFFPGKNLGALGDAGFVMTHRADLAERVRELVNHGRKKEKYIHYGIGHNERLDALQAAVLSIKLDHILDWTEARRRLAARYDQMLDSMGVKRIKETPNSKAVYHQYVIELEQRDRVSTALKEQGISTGIHYPVPVHLQPAYSGLPGQLPISERASGRILSLPIFPEMTADQQDSVVSALRRALS